MTPEKNTVDESLRRVHLARMSVRMSPSAVLQRNRSLCNTVEELFSFSLAEEWNYSAIQ
jgi:hypothetical protein